MQMIKKEHDKVDLSTLKDRWTSDRGYNIEHHAMHGKGNGNWVSKSLNDNNQWENISGGKRPNMLTPVYGCPLWFAGRG